jgi:hypothetical protein
MAIVRHTAGIELTPEREERIRATQKRHAAIDPNSERLTPDEFINWHPVGGITWEERARQMAEKLLEDGIILLNSTGSLGHLPGTIELSLETSHWFADFLEGTKSNDTHTDDGKEYEAKRDSDGNVVFTEIRMGSFVSDLVFASWEIRNILETLREKQEMAMQNQKAI